ncbi:small multi-drug export protein [Niallia endozanthoxylica]|uniref:Small multi-drug export protein n=1 Tax=Niallia endozanthoxylica TaxID=2036016 RepID=A0A5J5HSS5_9BACI|nr:small multi-drug export protein [Niallia endozanthoxylica]KAA9023921.1 small multi-drug export protein [Niallia endozanthoxylica]
MDFLLAVWEYILVFLLAAIPWIEIAAIIPLSIIAGLNPVLVGLLAFVGNLSTVYLLIIFIEKYQQWRNRKKKNQKEKPKRQERAIKVWNKYGLPGLALLGPFLIGSHVSVIVGLALGAKKQTTLLWITISLVLWSIVFTVLSYYGIEFLVGI